MNIALAEFEKDQRQVIPEQTPVLLFTSLIWSLWRLQWVNVLNFILHRRNKIVFLSDNQCCLFWYPEVLPKHHLLNFTCFDILLMSLRI